jgi:hypothetical protein
MARTQWLERHRTGEWVALGGAAILCWLAWDQVWLLPLRLMVVAFHESGHALAALATGGEVVAVSLHLDESGETWTRGGWELVVTSAGYLGSLGWGLGLLVATRGNTASRGLCVLLGGAFAAAALGWVRPVLSFGFVEALALGGVLTLLGLKGSHDVCRGVLRFVGLFSVLYALWDIAVDAVGDGVSDMVLLQRRTGVPGLMWAALWEAAGIAGLWLARRWVV